MNRRLALFHLAALAWLPVAARAAVSQPYEVSLISGGMVNGVWQAGILIEMEPGWKTYWRIPGDAGIPPQFEWQGSANVDSVNVALPVPTRFHDASGDAIGYHDRVLFPLAIVPKNPAEPPLLKLDMFFAVCNNVCIPVKVQRELLLGAINSGAVLETWQNRVPVAGSMVSKARIEVRAGEPMLALTLTNPVNDVFVEADGQIYFGKPDFDVAAGEAWLPLFNVKDLTLLQDLPLKLTLSSGNTGIEQTVTVN